MNDTLFGDSISDPMDSLLDELHRTPGWPADDGKDRALLLELSQQFPTLDLKDELSKFRVWLLQQDPGEARRRVTSRGRLQTLRNWCSRTVRTSPQARRQNGSRSRTNTIARPAGAFGGKSTYIDRW